MHKNYKVVYKQKIGLKKGENIVINKTITKFRKAL